MKNVKIFEAYKKKKDFLMDYQLCRAYLGENVGVTRLVEIILLNKFKNPDDHKFITGIIRATGGKRDAFVDLSRAFGYKEKVSDILASFVEHHFDVMVASIQTKLGNYPLTFRDIVEQSQD